MEKKTINHDLSTRKWAITELVLETAFTRKVSTQLVRAEIIEAIHISPALLSLLEKADNTNNTISLTLKVADRLNWYFTHYLKREVMLCHSERTALALAA